MIELTDGRGADVVFRSCRRRPLSIKPMRRIAWEGRYLVIGFASGRIPTLPVNIALLKNAALVGVFWGAYMQQNPDVIRRSYMQLAAWYNEGKLHPHIYKTYKLEDAATALRDLMERRVMGKVLLTT